jgi:signal peptidase I
MNIKITIQYFLLLTGLLLAIWSQSWLLSAIVLLTALLIWQPTFRRLFKNILDKVPLAAVKFIEWVVALGIAVSFVWFINGYALSFYTMSSNSMSPAHSINELIVINKLAYGPACKVNKARQYKRLKGYSAPRQGDVVAFHFPEADTCFVEHAQEDYYFIKRQFEATQTSSPLLKEKIQFVPVNERQIFIKRLIGLPGDTLRIINGDYYINNQRLTTNELCIARYELRSTAPSDMKEQIRRQAMTTFQEQGAQQVEIQQRLVKAKGWKDYLTRQEETMNMPNVYVFPFKASYFWNGSHLGPIILPTKNKTVRLTLTNLPLYQRIIEAYEGNTLSIQGENFVINGKKTNEYTFKMNYYWVGGDNIKHSFDSRYWGFVPENHIIGRVEKLSADE